METSDRLFDCFASTPADTTIYNFQATGDELRFLVRQYAYSLRDFFLSDQFRRGKAFGTGEEYVCERLDGLCAPLGEEEYEKVISPIQKQYRAELKALKSDDAKDCDLNTDLIGRP